MNDASDPKELGSPRSSFQKWLYRLLRRPLWTLSIALAVTVTLGWYLPRLRIGSSVHDLAIEDLRETANYRAFKQVFESDEIIRIVVRDQNVLSQEMFSRVADLAEKSAAIKGVRRVISLPGIKSTVDQAGKWSQEEFAAHIAPVRLFSRNLISDDRRATVITLVLENDTSSDAVIASVDELLRAVPKSISAYQIGMPLVSKALADYTVLDLRRLPPLTLAIIAVILLVLFRNLPCLLLPVLAVITAQVWTFGLMAWLNIPMSMLTMIVPVLLIAVGTAYCMHLCSAYVTEARQGGSAYAAVYRVFNHLALPTLLAVVTTVIGLGALTINRIDAIREFALFASFGMLSLLVILLIALPAAMVLFPLPGGRSRPEGPLDRLLTRFLTTVARLNIVHRRKMAAVLAIVMLACLVGIFRIRVETNPVEYFKASAPINRHFHDIYRDLSGSFPVNVVMTGNSKNYFEDVTNVKEVDRLQAYLETLPGVDKVISFAEYLKLVNYALNQFDSKYYALPEEGFELRMAFNNFNVILGNDTLPRFMTSDFSRTNLLLLTHLSSSRDFLRLRDTILAKVAADFSAIPQYEVTGLGLAVSASSYQLTAGQIKSLTLTFALVFAMMALLFFSTKVGFVAIVPTLFPVVVNFGVMGWFNIHLSVATGLIASIAIGLSVDDTIHYLFRYNNEFKKDLDKDRALKDTILTVGRPIVATTVTITCGFAILMLSHFTPTGLFGLLMVVTMLSALAGVLLLLPGLMLKVELVTAWDLLKWIPVLGGIPPGIAHELKQPLNTIKVGSEFLKRTVGRPKPPDEGQVLRVVGEISAQVDRASAIIDRLIEVGRKQEVETQPLDLNHPIQEALSLVGSELKLDNIALNVELDPSLPPIAANSQRLAQVLFNLLANARDAILAEPAAVDEETDRAITVRTFVGENRVTATVTDTGVGMADHIKERIFEPFFSTKAEGKGKGLGLAISHQIVKGYGGRIELETQKGIGTTVRLSFPLCSG
jgi:predicted RND superfamily exporter protein